MADRPRLPWLQGLRTRGLIVALDEIPHLPGEAPADDRRRELFYHNITRFLPILLGRKDRMSMACGFKVRVPFCDYRLVDYV